MNRQHRLKGPLHPLRTVTVALLLPVTLLAFAGCGSNDAAPTASTSSAAGPGGQQAPAQLQKIQECLTAAGLATAMPSGMRSGVPSGMPSGGPSGMPSGRPSGMPSGGPDGMPSGAPGGMQSSLSDPKVQAALKACGIDTPTGGASQP